MEHGLANIRCSKIYNCMIINNIILLPITGEQSYSYQLDGWLKSAEIFT